MYNQDTKQRINVYIIFFIELYRVTTSSLLLLFVPQNCNGHACSIEENVEWGTIYNSNPGINQEYISFYNATLIFNFITLLIFFVMYIIEIIRENILINYLDVNIHLPNSNDEIGIALQKLDTKIQAKILKIDKSYQHASYFSIFIFCINAISSGIIINQYYLNNQTIITFVSYILFMTTKLLNVYHVINTDSHIFYSSYLQTNVQFNDIDSKLKANQV